MWPGAATRRSLLLLCACFCGLVGSAAATQTLELEIKQVRTSTNQRTNEPIVEIVLSEVSARAIAVVTTDNVGRSSEIRADGRTVVKSVIREPILGGTLVISGYFTREQANEIAARLSSGAAKLEFEVLWSD